MTIETVSSDNGGREGKWVALSIMVILLFSALLLPFHQAAEQPQTLASYQVSVKDLAPQELAIIADLRLAHEEIRNIHQDNIDLEGIKSWPDISELEALWLAPFYRDKSWEYKGRHDWQQIGGSAYQGLRQLREGSASVILLFSQQQPVIWLDLSGNATPFANQSSVTEPALIEAGWKQVVFTAQEDNHHH